MGIHGIGRKFFVWDFKKLSQSAAKHTTLISDSYFIIDGNYKERLYNTHYHLKSTEKHLFVIFLAVKRAFSLDCNLKVITKTFLFNCFFKKKFKK